jgi:hypothetical protein
MIEPESFLTRSLVLLGATIFLFEIAGRLASEPCYESPPDTTRKLAGRAKLASNLHCSIRPCHRDPPGLGH